MKRSRFTESQIVSILKEADAGAKIKELCRKHGISDADVLQLESEVRWHEDIGLAAPERDRGRVVAVQENVR